MKERQIHIPRLLVRFRLPLFILMTVATVVCTLLIPHVNVNSNMARYLPDDSPMKMGMDIIETQIPAILEQAGEFGSVFADGNDLMPTDLPQTLALGVVLLFVVLLIMSSSVMEVLLFMVTVGFAVVINMGTNALLSSVSMMTNTLASVLQMVLSMDYSIILMNRYRQEKLKGALPAAAMEEAIGGATPAILSSAFTTVVSLLMLCFIKLKIGADLGVVLAKGVTISLICNFTVLPTLIIWGDKGVEKTRKKVPRLPAAPLSRFQNRFRIPIAVAFLLVFIAFTLLQRRTPLSFEPKWDSALTEGQPIRHNALLLLYDNAEEIAVPALLDSIGRDPLVRQGVSYPSLVLRPRTIPELKALTAELAPEDTLPAIPEDLLQLVYYAQTHPRRTERMSLQELQQTAEELASRGMIPEGRFNPEQLMKTLLPSAPREKAARVNQDPKSVVQDEEPTTFIPDTAAVIPDSTAVIPESTAVIPESTAVIPESYRESPEEEEMPGQVGQDVELSGQDWPLFTYELATKSYTAEEMASITGQDSGQVSTLFRLAGKRRGTMTPKEFISFVRENILSKRLYAAFIPKGTAERLAAFEKELDTVIAAGPGPRPEEPALPNQSDTLAIAVPADTLFRPVSEPFSMPVTAQEEPEAVATVESEPEPEPTPQDVLLDMALSGERYTASRMYQALSAAGIPVSQEEMDLLYLYAGARQDFCPETAIAPGVLLDYVADTLLKNPALAGFVPDTASVLISSAREQLLSGVGMLRGSRYSAAAVMSDYRAESDSTFAFVDRVRATADQALEKPHFWVGESQMYKELKDGFPRELLLLTLLTVLSIFLIVAITFRSILIPIPLIMTILAGVYANVWASGLGGNAMYYLSFLVIQGILMGATIDYSILFTSYYLQGRKERDIAGALESAYAGSSHSILTSGLILAIVPYVMSITMKDAMIAGILSSLAFGALAILLLILFLLPGTLACLDRLLKKD